ncbi:MAG: site-2 protease family protein [Halanaerobiales bacterium]|nr:site-2 protease family protein [Halanaerobiales bacterium]
MFKSSIQIGKISDIPIKLHISFIIALPFIAWAVSTNIEMLTGIMNIPYQNMFLPDYLLGLLITIFLFASVALHELGHSFVARSKGHQINSITLMLLGGIAEIKEMTENPDDELKISIIGPMVSLAIGLTFILIAQLISSILIADLRFLILYLGQLNVFLAIFNMLPAFPNDGGRVLRALIARKKDFLQATKIAVTVSKVIVFLFGVIGFIYGNFILILIAFFIYMRANQEFQYSMLKDTLSDLRVRDLMSTDVSYISSDLTVKELLEMMLHKSHSGYPVIDDDKLIGCVTMEDIRNIKSDKHHERYVKDIMSTDIKKISPNQDVNKALQILLEEDIGRLMVMEDDKLVGIITRTDIFNAFKIKQVEKNL